MADNTSQLSGRCYNSKFSTKPHVKASKSSIVKKTTEFRYSNGSPREEIAVHEVLRDRGSSSKTRRRISNKSEELERLQHHIKVKKTLKDELNKLTYEIASITGQTIT